MRSLLASLRGIDPLKRLFWSELNYDQVNRPISRSGWPKAALDALAEDPVLLAGHGDFHVIYGRLQSSGRLRLTDERAVVNRLLAEHPYALLVFSDSTQQHWHFVNVRYDASHTVGRERRRVLRRISVGPDERLRTAAERVSMLDVQGAQLAMLGRSPLEIQRQHDEAFNVEKVTAAFFEGYKAVYTALRKDLEGQTGDAVWAHDYALQFLNRIMFLYFIQRKRWLGEDLEFLKTFWQAYRSSKGPADSFFRRWLSVLFFEAFNNRFGPKQHFSKEINEALQLAPYLNGGLFERNKLDRKYDHTVSDELFRGIFEFFEGYNFTIAEDSPLDQEVAVDPEMIGKVYESLVNVHEDEDESGQWGIFYTPRTEIDVMCRLALVDHLANHLGDEHKQCLYRAIFAFEADEKAEADRALTQEDLWPRLRDLLHDITVVDPACGSGSFLVGMLHILFDLRRRANDALGEAPSDPQYHYELKKQIIGENLYGVDVKEWAVRVAELRLWLQLVVDADLPLGIRKSRPLLPNLDFKLRTGDSLVQEVGGVDLSHVHGRATLPRPLTGRLTQLKGAKLKYFRNDKGDSEREKREIAHEELRVFKDILAHRVQALEKERKNLEARIAHPEEQRGLEMTGLPRGKATQLELRVAEMRQKLDQVQEELAELSTAQQAMAKEKQPPFVWDIAFVEVFEGDRRGFDIVVGNPPYVRQEKIAPPRPFGDRHEATLEERRAYKAKLMKSVYALFPRFFGYLVGRENVARKLDAKNDLYVYFYFHGLALLSPKASFCFITSNSWLDVGYGRDLQEFLLRHGHVTLILDNQVRRSFRADVNTVIALLGPADDRNEHGLGRTARFVMATAPFEHLLSPVIFEEIEGAPARATKPEYRVHPRRQQDLFEEALAPVKTEGAKPKKGRPAARYESNKWGGKYLRAPDIYWRILERAGDRLVPLGEIAEVRRGFTTGANDFFYVRVLGVKDGIARVVAGDGSEHEIEAQCVRCSALTKTREVIRPTPSHAEITHRIVFLPEKLTGLPKARQYVRWGEGAPRRYHERPTCASRPRWYRLEERPHPDLVMPIGRKRRCVVGIAPKSQVGDNLVDVMLQERAHFHEVAASAYGTFAVIFWEAMGRANFGQGLLKTQTYEIEMLPVLIRPQGKAGTGGRLRAAVDSIRSRAALMLYDDVRQPDRVALDDAFLEAIGFDDPAERTALVKELQDAACRMIWNRMAKTDNARESRMTYDEWLATGEPFGDVPEEDEGEEE